MSGHQILTLKEDCTGCFGCANICPKVAISLPENDEGFYFPTIDQSKCIDCGLCDRYCPIINPLEPVSTQEAYYVKAKDRRILDASSSGGAFHMLAVNILKDGGIVYGASFNYDKLLRLECHSTKDVALDDLQKSKYVQSFIGDSYIHIKKDLDSGHKVLFCGTPCQVSGLKSFLRKNYEWLFTADFICHGVPSMDMLRKHIDYKGLKNVCHIDFRPKRHAWVDDLVIEYGQPNHKQIYRIPWNLDEFFSCFEYSQNLRRSCRNCRYCNGNRFSDFTLADFWGVFRYKPELFDPKGLSLVMANTSKGIETLNILKENSDYTIAQLPIQYTSYVYARDRSKPDSPYQNKIRDRFLGDVYTMGYRKALKKNHLGISNYQIFKYNIKSLLKQILKRSR